MNRYLTEYNEKGFTLVPKLISDRARQRLFDTTIRVFHKYTPDVSIDELRSLSWEDPRFSDHLIRFRSKSPALFGAMYDSLQTCVALQQMMCEEPLLEMAATLAGDTMHGFSSTGQMMRMDPPHDTRNSLEWHQEASYYKQNLIPDHSLVVWTPLHDVAVEHGPVLVCSGSHKLGLLDVPSSGKENYTTSEQYRVPQDRLEAFEPFSVVASAGDVLLFHMNLFHRSGLNMSSVIRFVAGVRFHRMLTPDFIPGRLIYKPNESVISAYQSGE